MLRFPEGMRDQIAEAARAAGRSMNAEIVARLQASFGVKSLETLGLFATAGTSFHPSQAARETAGTAGQQIAQEEYVRQLAAGASSGSLAQELWEKQKQSDQEELRKMIAAAVGPTIQDFLKEFEERERKDRQALIEQITGSNVIKELASGHLTQKPPARKKT